MSQGSEVSVVTKVRPGLPRNQGSVLDFSVLYSIQIGSGANPASYSVNTGISFPELKRPEREFDNSPVANAEIKNGWSCTSSWSRIFITCFNLVYFTWKFSNYQGF